MPGRFAWWLPPLSVSSACRARSAASQPRQAELLRQVPPGPPTGGLYYIRCRTDRTDRRARLSWWQFSLGSVLMADEPVIVPPALPAAAHPASPRARPDDAERQARLDAMKRQATGLLALAAVVFAGASLLEGRYPWLGYVRATAEASLVGGLADWFAVTALFRRPLGLPIPHTAIVATRKERIGRILGNFVQNHFLSRDVIAANLRKVHPAERAAQWLADRE